MLYSELSLNGPYGGVNKKRLNPLFCHSGPWWASTRERLSCSASAALEKLPTGFSCVNTFIARNRAVSYMDRYDDKSPKEALGMQGIVACGAMRIFSPGATSSWTGAASSLACSLPPPAPRVRVATPILTSKTGLRGQGAQGKSRV